MTEEKYRVTLENVSKKFKIGCENESALSRFISIFSGIEHKRELQVLKNISFSAKAGENIGIIGKNGSGKSTLLRIIAEIYSFDEGKLEVNGRMVYLTGFGQGLNPRLTMRENIYLIGSVMGLSQKDIQKRFNEIVEFSGLDNFLDTKVYQFSSGMTSRLSISSTLFCVAHANPDILLIDEAFSGGADIDFQEKSLKKMEELIRSGATVILVSHDLGMIKKYCNKVICFDRGRIAKIGGPDEVIEFYEKNV